MAVGITNKSTIKQGQGADSAVLGNIEIPDIKVNGVETPEVSEPSGVSRPMEVANDIFDQTPVRQGSLIDKIDQDIKVRNQPRETQAAENQQQPQQQQASTLASQQPAQPARQNDQAAEEPLAPKVEETSQNVSGGSEGIDLQSTEASPAPRTNSLASEPRPAETKTEQEAPVEAPIEENDDPVISDIDIKKNDDKPNKRRQDLARSLESSAARSEISESTKVNESRKPISQTVSQDSVVPASVEKELSDQAKHGHLGKTGAAVTGQLSSDPTLSLEQVSVGDEILALDWTVATSPLPQIVEQEAQAQGRAIDMERMATDVEYRKEMISDVLNAAQRQFLITKHPVPNDNSSHMMYVRVHKGLDVHTNPIITKVFNMDYDGDTTGVAFDIGPVENGRARTTADYLISHVGDLGIDPEAFGYFPWGDAAHQLKVIEAALAPFGLTPKLIKEVDKAWTKMTKAKNIDDGFKEFIRTVDSIASRFVTYTDENGDPKTNYTRAQLLCGILQSLHTENNHVMRYYIGINSDQITDPSVFESLGYNKEAYQSATIIDDPTTIDGNEWPFRAMITEGQLPHDFEQLAEALHIEWKKVKKRDGKTVNLYFRVPAGIAKQIRRSAYIQVGTSPEGNNASLTKNTIYELLSAAMSNIAETDETLLESTTEARVAIVSQTGFLKNYNSLGDFLYSFVAHNNLVAYEFNAGSVIVDSQFNVRQRNNMTIREIDSNPTFYADVRQAFIQCYGQYTIRKIFGPSAADIPAFAAWMDVPLAEWARNNFVDRTESYGKREKIGRQTTAQEQLEAFAASMLAQKTSSASSFNKEVIKLMDSIGEKISDTDSYVGVFDAMQETMMALGGEIFIRRGLASPEGFRKSKLLKAFKDSHNDTDKMIGAIYTELAEDMFSKTMTRYNQVLELKSKYDVEGDSTQKIVLENQIRKATMEVFEEVKAIAQTNILWKNVATEWFYRKFGIHNGAYFPRQNPKQSVLERSLTNNKYGKTAKEMAIKDLFNTMHAMGDSPAVVSWNSKAKAWDSKPATDLHGRKVSLLDQYGNPHTNLHNTYIFTEMMFGKLNGGHSGVNRTFAGKNAALDNVRAAQRFVDGLKLKSRSEMKQNVDATINQLITEHNGKENEVEAIIRNHVENEAPVFMDKRLMFNCLDMDLVYALSEKAKTSRAANIIFQAVNLIKNGGVMSDAERFFDASMDRMEISEFSRNITVIRHLLSHPEQSITVYDPVAMKKTVVNKKKIMNGRSYIQLLRDEPELAMMLRNHSICVSAASDSKDVVSIKASNTLYGSLTKSSFRDKAFDNAVLEFADNPYFYAFAKCFDAKNSETKVRMALTAIADFGRSDKTIEEWMDENLPAPQTEGEQDVYNDLKHDIPGYAARLKDWVHVEDGWKQSFKYTANYYALRNLLSTAKTQTSTAINGYTTYKINAPLTFLATYTAPECDAPARQIDSKNFFDNDENNPESWHNFIGVVTESGWIVSEASIDRIRKESGETVGIYHPADCTSPGCPCHHHSMADQSSNNQPSMQSTALGRLLQVFRDKGTEALNLKIAKLGDDGQDSISKLSRFNQDGWAAVAEQVKIMAEKNLPDARIELANWLKDVSMKLGYDMLHDLDYVNVAQIMIRKLPDNTFDILSIQEISQLQRNVMFNYLDTVDNKKKMTTDDLGSVCDEALANFQGYGELEMGDIFRRMNPSPMFAFGEQNKAGDVLSRAEEKYVNQSEQPWLSSSSRNRNFLRGVMTRLAAAGKPVDTSVTDKQRRSEAKRIFESSEDSLPGNFAKKLRKAVNSKDGYVLTSITTANGTSMINDTGAGPRVLVAITGDANPQDIEKAMIWARNRGGTVVFDKRTINAAKILDGMSDNALTRFAIQSAHEGELGYTVSWSDILMNQRMPNEDGTQVKIGTNLYNDDQLSFIVYDPLNEHMLGDAETQAYRNLVDKTRIKKCGTQSIDIYDIFAESLEDPQSLQTATVSFPTAEEILNLFVKEDGKHCILDPGANRNQKINEQLAQYLDRFLQGHDDYGYLTEETLSIGDIVGLVKLNKNGETIWGVVRAFDLIGGKSGPAFMNVSEVRLNSGTQSIDFDWNIDTGLLDDNGNVRSAKVFEGINAFNKYILRSKLPEYGERRDLEDGTPLDACVAEFSVGSRLTGEQRVKEKLNTLTVLAQRANHGYNIADIPGTFPGADSFKDMIATGQVTMSLWGRVLYDTEGNPQNWQILPEGSDPRANAEINNVLRNFLDGGINPSLFLCSYFKTEDGNLRHHIMPPRWSDLYNNGPQATDALMKFFHLMIPNIVPDGLHGDPTGCLMNNDLQLYVPFYGEGENREVVKKGHWCDVMVSQMFFDEHVDVLRRPSVKSNANSILTSVSRRSMGQPIAKAQVLDLVDYATAKFDAGDVPNEISTGDAESNQDILPPHIDEGTNEFVNENPQPTKKDEEADRISSKYIFGGRS